MAEVSPSHPIAIPSAGTQVVTKVATRPIGGGDLCPAGIVGVVIAVPVDPDGACRVRCVDGVEIRVRSGEMEVLSLYQTRGLRTPQGDAVDYGSDPQIIYRCVIGSRAYGLDVEGSDTDRRGVFIAPCEMHWSLFGTPDQLENHETQECYWELKKFIVLALKANPSILECLYTPMVERAEALGEELLKLREIFLSKLVYQTYNGYVLSQFHKMNRDLRSKGKIKPKHAMHLIRLLLSGITVLRDGFVPVSVAAFRERLLAIREGRMAWEEVQAWRGQLHKEFDAAFATTTLPERPDYERANDFLIRARRSMVH
ncbi:MAG: DNA polymerase beta superfamily protein [Phycisphaerae bacterium]